MPERMLGQPAYSLWTRLDAVRQWDPNQHWRGAWQGVLGTNSEDETQELLIELAGLYREVVQLIRSTVERPEHLLLHSPDWRHAVMLDNVVPDNPITQSGFVLSHSATAALYGAAVVLDRTSAASQATEPRRQSLGEAIEALRVAVDEAADLPADVLVYVRERIGEVSRALRNYHLTGDLPLAEVAHKLAGDAVAQPSLWGKVASSSVGKPFMNFVAGAIIVVHGYAGFSSDMVTSIENTQAIIQSIQEAAPRAIEQGPAPRELESGNGARELPPGPTELAIDDAGAAQSEDG